MAKQICVVIHRECHPEQCSPEDGVCPAVGVCKRGILEQEALGESPMLMSAEMCQACGDCARACPLKAIHMRER
jgi:translation initiation factor RLI1